MMARINLMPKSTRTGVAYSISKHFVVIWFAKTDAARFGAKGVRCLSVTPGNFDTPMGQLESAEAQTFTAHSALKRNGRPEEIAALYALLLDQRLALSHRHGHRHGRRCHCQWGQRPFPLTHISPILSIQHKTGFPAATGKPVLSFSVVTAPDMSQC